ncbi:MAG: hypothetical protein DCC65_00440 [Planctomycetota bacterium]|nr:MAG: hypothetical protein DCC65_00440 [Planctomycetota bacterium]
MVCRPAMFIIALCVAALFAADAASACSVCQGDPDSNMVKAAQGGVVVMVIITYGVLMLFGTLAAVCFVRYRRQVRTGRMSPPAPATPPERADE